MPKFSKSSLEKLETCDERLQRLMKEAIKYYDFSVLCGHRGKEEQNRVYEKGNSSLKWPYSKHNKKPSLAVDIAPYPIDWHNIDRFYELAGVVKTCAEQLNLKVRWGGDWLSFKDYPHWQV